jgi:CBS domain-containing protein
LARDVDGSLFNPASRNVSLIHINAAVLGADSFAQAPHHEERRMRARDVMTRAVATTTPETTVEKVAKLMVNLRISGVPVLDRNGQLVGIVTEGDLLRRAETGTERQRSRWSELFSANSRLAEEYVKSHARRVEDIMTREVVSVEELASLGEIAELMETKRIKRVPVVHNGKIVGIVSRADLLQVLASGGTTTADEDTDRLIRERLLAELRKQEWATPAESNVVVSDGVVHFWGTVGSQGERTALRVVAENTPGVRGIEDHTISGPRYLSPLFPAI